MPEFLEYPGRVEDPPPAALPDGTQRQLSLAPDGSVRVSGIAGGGGGGGAVTIANGADTVQGTLADAAITTDAAGTVSGKLRGLVKILASAWDSVNNRLKVALGEYTPVAGKFPVDGSSVTQPVSAAALPLPTGAATEATLAAIDAGKLEETTFTGRVGEVQASPTANTVLGRLKSVEDKLDTLNAELAQKTEPANTQPVSAASLPLPTGAATEATLAAIDAGKLEETTFTGRVGEVQASPTANTVLGRLKSVEDKLDTLNAELAQKTEPANTQAVSAASLPLPTGAATEATLAARLSESDFDSKIGALTETAPGTDTASSGLNGRLQRIAQRLTSLIALFPAALTGSGNFKVSLQEWAAGALDVTPASPAANDYLPVRLTDGTDFYAAGGGAGGDGAIVDGANSAVKATVLNYSNANPVAVRLSDTNGDYVAAGAGTQYTEDAAAAADPVGGMLMAVRADSPSAVTSTDGDNIALRATNKGELYVKHLDAVPVTGPLTDTQLRATAVPISASSLPLPTGAATESSLASRLSEADFDSKIGSLTETAPGTDTASSGLNGRLQRIAQRITSLIALFPAALTGSGNFKVSLQESNASQAVTGPLTDAQLRATAVPVSLASVPSHAVTNAGTFPVQESGAALTALQLIDDPVKTDDAAFTPGTDKVLMAGFEFDDTTPDSVNEGDAGAARMSANRCQYIIIRDGAGNERGLAVDANGEIQIAGSRNSLAIASLPDAVAVGKAAHDAAVSGAPVRVGAKSLNWAAAVTDVSADGDAVDLIADRSGRLYTAENHPNSWNVNGEYSGAQTNTSLKAAPGSGLSLYITDLIISNGATAGSCKLIDGSGGATKAGTFYFAINGGCVIRFRTPIKLTANTALCFTSTTVTTHSVTVCGYTAP